METNQVAIKLEAKKGRKFGEYCFDSIALIMHTLIAEGYTRFTMGGKFELPDFSFIDLNTPIKNLKKVPIWEVDDFLSMTILLIDSYGMYATEIYQNNNLPQKGEGIDDYFMRLSAEIATKGISIFSIKDTFKRSNDVKKIFGSSYESYVNMIMQNKFCPYIMDGIIYAGLDVHNN